jgi:hypothetical protein
MGDKQWKVLTDTERPLQGCQLGVVQPRLSAHCISVRGRDSQDDGGVRVIVHNAIILL